MQIIARLRRTCHARCRSDFQESGDLIWLQASASIQLRKSLSKLAKRILYYYYIANLANYSGSSESVSFAHFELLSSLLRNMKGGGFSDDWDSRRGDGWSGSWDSWKNDSWKNDSWKTNESREYGAWRGSGDDRKGGSDPWKTNGSSETTGWSGSSDECKKNEKWKANGFGALALQKRTNHQDSWPDSRDNWQKSEGWKSIGAREKDAWTAGQTTQRNGPGWKDQPNQPNKRLYFETNKKIVEAAATRDPKTFLNLLDDLCKSRIQLNHVNVATILHKSAKARLRIPDHVVSFFAETLWGLDGTF